ncbi:MAG: homoserine dehydrogenase [Pseudomonadota bacterium]|nr:homoserine dehydrogenase [Pseudomonadota bacterium]MBU1150645.1 homoserine dehydrogenase [Pseudomonadota bacterium]MBU1184787.1 homoserine dehydrogenase [Pseudomonadota bacterium]MBU2235004.1 homoserine dehydrogenase [Pseudomonadota bacterium]MBU2252157.1 homoserine dehydrogenase [Pseudomonadota bacterium]
MKKISLGLIGFGTIGTGLVKLLQENGELIAGRLGAKIDLKRIADIDIRRSRGIPVDTALLTTDAGDILNDPGIDIVVELMGGYEPARTFILAALSQGKHVVTANKALLATHGDEIFQSAVRHGVNIGFEASVGGTIPIIKTVKESLIANRILSISAIMNGTANFILTKMTDEGKAFAVVLKEAQALGFAEADPAYDVEGIDAAHKLAILLSLAYGKKVRLEDLYREGITRISEQDIEFAHELGYRIKLLAIAIQRDQEVEARLHPTMIPFDHLLANVNGNFNAFHIIGDAADSVFLYGQGAGMMPTASAVVSDIVDIARDVLKGISGRIPPRVLHEEIIEDIRLLPFDQIRTNYYFRFSAVDRPGVLSRISGILGENNISIAAVIQKGRKQGGAVPVVMTTYKARELDVRRAMEDIDRLDVVMGKTMLIRIEDDKL